MYSSEHQSRSQTMSDHDIRFSDHTSKYYRRVVVGQPFCIQKSTRLAFVLVALISIAGAADAAADIPDTVPPRRPSRRAQLSYKLTEELPAGTVIAEDLIGDAGLGVAAVDTGSGRHATVATTKRRSAGLVLLDAENHLPFRLENDGRRLVTTETVDRDARCPQQVTCRFEVDLAVPSSSNFEKIRVYIDLLDINDNSPDFGRSSLRISVPEFPTSSSTMAPNNFTVIRLPLPTAIDIDSPMNGLDRYQLLPKNASELFRLSTESNLLSLEVIKPLDREKCATYSVQVVAFDSGSPRRSSVLLVDVDVSDINDHAPSFDRDVYHVTIPEDAEIGRTLLRVGAIDPDLGDAGRVRFRMQMSKSAAPSSALFNVDLETGEVTLAGHLDRETKSVHHLTVIAMDSSQSMPLTSTATVVITVSDVDDNLPSISVEPAYVTPDDVTDDYDDSDTLKVPASSSELRSGGDLLIAHVITTDVDASQNNRHTDCRLQQDTIGNKTGESPPLFRLDSVNNGDSPSATNTEYHLYIVRQPSVSGLPLSVIINCLDGARPPVTRRLSIVVDPSLDSSESENSPPAVIDGLENLVTSSTTVNQLLYNSSDCSRTRPDLCGLHPVDIGGANSSGLNTSLGDAVDENDMLTSSSGYSGVISGQVIIMASIAAGFTALSAGVAAALLCVSTKSDGRRRDNHRNRRQPGLLIWSKVKNQPQQSSGLSASSLAIADVGTRCSSSDIKRQYGGVCDDDGDEVALCRNGSSARLNGVVADDDFVLTLESEPLNYSLRRHRWLESMVHDREHSAGDIDSGVSGVTDMTASLTCGGGCAQLHGSTPCFSFSPGQGQREIQDLTEQYVTRDPPIDASTYRSFPAVDRLSTLSTSSTSAFLPPPSYTKVNTQHIGNNGRCVTANGCQYRDDSGWFSVSTWNTVPVVPGVGDCVDASRRSSGSVGFLPPHSALSSFDSQPRRQYNEYSQGKYVDAAIDESNLPPPPPQVMRVGMMAHSTSTGSRKSVRFADETDFE